jgi:hypothetical protein
MSRGATKRKTRQNSPETSFSGFHSFSFLIAVWLSATLARSEEPLNKERHDPK